MHVDFSWLSVRPGPFHHSDGSFLPGRGDPGQHLAHPVGRDHQLGGGHRGGDAPLRFQCAAEPPFRALVGVSAGAATWAGIHIVSKEFDMGDNIVIILPDTGERYLSTDLFES